MPQPFKYIGLFIRKDDPILENAVVQVCQFLNARGLSMVINEPLSFLTDLEVISFSDFP